MLLYGSLDQSSSESVTMAPQSNIYEAGTADFRALFDGYIDDDSPCIALAVSAEPLDQTARSAIEKSLEALGYGKSACSFATLAPHGSSADAGVKLDAGSLFLLVEALDPLLLVISDEESARLTAQAYRTAFDLDAPTRIFGRPAAVFGNLAKLLTTKEGKQRVWHVFKAFPKR